VRTFSSALTLQAGKRAREAEPRRARVRLGGIAVSPAVPIAFLAPALSCIAVFVFWPAAYSAFLSLHEWRLGFADRRFIGLLNYKNLLASAKFLNAAKNTLVITAWSAVLSTAIGLALALKLSRMTERRAGALQTMYFIPVTATLAAMAIVWRFMFNTQFGFLNAALEYLGLARVKWLQTDSTATAAVIALSVWSSFGYAMVLFLAGLSNIPKTLLESAIIDGAGGFRRLFGIVLPLLSPTTIFVAVVMTIRSLEAFDAVKVLTDGGPVTATQTLSHLLYEQGFKYFNTGFASALAVAFFAVTMAMSRVQLLADRWVHY
jgi:multiple sugar transport system permease protein